MDRYTEGMRDAAFEYGVKRLAADLDMSETRLYKKLDPDGPISLTVADFFRINRLLDDVRCVQALMDDLGLVGHRRAESGVDASLFDLMANHQASGGDVAATIRDALADGRVTADEHRDIRRAVRAQIDALTALEDEMGAMAEPRLAKA